MPTNRNPRSHAPRVPRIMPEALALFVKLDAMPRRSWSFTDEARELAQMLNLTTEWWTGNTPLDKSRAPCHPEGYAAHTDWHRCRRIRIALQAAAQEAGAVTVPSGGAH